MGKTKEETKRKGKGKSPKPDKKQEEPGTPTNAEEAKPEETEPEGIVEEEPEKPTEKVVVAPAQTGRPRKVGEKTPKITIVNNSSQIIDLGYHGGRVSLKPGPNAVDRHVYDTHLAKHPTVQLYSGMSVGKRHLQPGKPPILEIDEIGPPAVAHRGIADALLFIGKICDIDILYSIEEGETRPEVKRAIDERKVEIGPTPVKKD